MAKPTPDEALTVVYERLSKLTPIEAAVAARSDRGNPAFSRWMEGTHAALKEAGLGKEAERLWSITHRSRHIEDAVPLARATLESLIDQIHNDPDALGLRRETPPSAAPPPRSVQARVPWPWIPAAAIAGFVGGLFGRATVVTFTGWIAERFTAAQLELQRWLARVVDALTPGPPVPMPTWIRPTAFWTLVGLMVVAGGILVELLASDVRREGLVGLWRSRWSRARLIVAVALAALVAALAR